MIEVLCESSADQALSSFENSQVSDETKRAVAKAILDFEASPDDFRWRKRRYQNPPLFGFTIRTSSCDYLVLWRQHSTENRAIVEYFGPDI